MTKKATVVIEQPATSNANTELSSVIETNAQLALPDIVAIFLAKYETDLYEKKSELSSIVSGIRKEIEDLDDLVLKAANFKPYEGLKMPKLNLVSKLDSKPTINWTIKEVCATIKVGLAKPGPGHLRTSDFKQEVSLPIKKADITKRQKLLEDVADRKDQLGDIIGLITDMPRKERQIKGAIGARRLKEQGLEDFINSTEMRKLIEIK